MPPETVIGDRPDRVPSAPVSFALEKMRTRPEFLRTAAARRQGTKGLLLQARHRRDDALAVRVGITASKKIGNAVARNRAKRRLRALVRELMPALAQPGWDYVLIARRDETVTRDFALLRGDLQEALRRVHAPSRRIQEPPR